VLTTDQKGVLAEVKIAAAAFELGAGVFLPLGDERYDLILDLHPMLMRVQCKWAVRKGEVIVVRCRRARRGRDGLSHRSYAPGEIDAIAAYCSDLDQAYLLPVEMSVDRACVLLRLGATRNNQRRRINWARDFELGATLAKLQGPIAQLGERLRGTQEVGGSSPPGSMFHPEQLGVPIDPRS
jgi:hypothetical protein